MSKKNFKISVKIHKRLKLYLKYTWASINIQKWVKEYRIPRIMFNICILCMKIMCRIKDVVQTVMFTSMATFPSSDVKKKMFHMNLFSVE